MSIVLIPRMSEKAYGLSKLRNTYVFTVEGGANKHTVARAVSAQYGVTVTDVNIVNQQGKQKRSVRKGGRPSMGTTSDFKKAYVSIKAGETLPLFAAVEEAEAKEAETQEKLDKAAAKATAKAQKDEEKSAAKQAKKENK